MQDYVYAYYPINNTTWLLVFKLLGVGEGKLGVGRGAGVCNIWKQSIKARVVNSYHDKLHQDKTMLQLLFANITKTCLYNFDPHTPHFYIVELGFTGVYISFSNYAKNIDCGYLLELPRRGGSNEYSQFML